MTQIGTRLRGDYGKGYYFTIRVKRSTPTNPGKSEPAALKMDLSRKSSSIHRKTAAAIKALSRAFFRLSSVVMG